MKIYISGKTDYREKFNAAEKKLVSQGHSVMNPAWLKAYPGYSWEEKKIIYEDDVPSDYTKNEV